MSKFLESIAILVGGTVGAGILGIPYVTSIAGFWTGIAVIVLLGIATLCLNLMLGEIVLRTSGHHQLTGYAEKYTGKIGKHFAASFMIFGIYGALVAYMIGVGNAAVFILGGKAIIYSLVFFVIASLVALMGIKSLGKAELIITTLLILVVIAIPIFSASLVKEHHFTNFDASKMFIPFGVVLFAFMGSAAIPSVKEELNSHRNLLKRAIIIGTLIPLAIYLVFTTIVVGIIGLGFLELLPEQRIATIALGFFIKGGISTLANIFAIMAMSTSFIALCYAMSRTLQSDHQLGKRTTVILTFSVPLIIFMLNYLLNLTSFIHILGIVGGITGGITGILIIIMHYKAKNKGDRKPEYSINFWPALGFVLALILALGIFHEISSII